MPRRLSTGPRSPPTGSGFAIAIFTATKDRGKDEPPNAARSTPLQVAKSPVRLEDRLMLPAATSLRVACFLLQALLVAAPIVADSPAHADAAPVEASDPAIAAAVDGSWRAPKARARDDFRHPVESLAFWGLKRGMTIVEIDPGANGWWTGILAPYARATGGRYVAALMVDAGVTGADSFEVVRAGFFKGVVDKAIFGDAEAVDFGPNHTEAIPAGSADFVLVARLPQLGA